MQQKTIVLTSDQDVFVAGQAFQVGAEKAKHEQF
jgi:hypothetical protein